MKPIRILLLCLPVLLAQQQYDADPVHDEGDGPPYPDYDTYPDPEYVDQIPQSSHQYEYQEQNRQPEQLVMPVPTETLPTATEPTEPGPLDCREEQYPCTRLYSVHKPCKTCLSNSPTNHLCFYSLRRVYVINKEVCVRTVCAHEELLRADFCRDKFAKCGVMASSGLCGSVSSSCIKSCGIC
ncbi:microfibrillar-associated protein 2 [Protopterus annectens]|uniref:microfibrillar-associated protein 2 n=1 Tax=Protopterus annectens TaxID=7888 RepID=UPI001CFA74AD|nr:microfibrillar-associated protein 2 [Protopterus annectens]